MKAWFCLLGVLLLRPLVGAESVGYWSGRIFDEVSIEVSDADTGDAIVGARIWILTMDALAAYRDVQLDPIGFAERNGAIERFGVRVFSGSTGKTTVGVPFAASGAIRGDGTRTTERSVSGIVIVEAPGYVRLEQDLVEGDQARSPEHRIRIEIKLKKTANQALQTTPMTRSGSEKTIVFGRPRRGV